MAEKKEKQYVSDNARLMTEWDWDKNTGLDPYSITWKSDKKAWWHCLECGHSWEAAVKNRSNGRGCPKCARIRQRTTFNQSRIRSNGSLATENPDLAKQWHPTKNGDLTPYDVTSKSGKRVWWLCDQGHEWEAGINNRGFHGRGCPYCAGQKAWKGYNDLATINPKLAREWHPSKNAPLTTQEVTANSGLKVWWRCENGHEWPATIDSRSRGTTCPYCSGRLPIEGETDLATTNPEIAAEWHPTKNGKLLPTMVSHGSSKKVWWMCNKGHEWQAVISSRQISGCPICSGETKTSFPEQTILFYFRQVTTAHSRYQIKPRTEIDIYLPELQIGIEYDGAYYHKGVLSAEREQRKQDTLSQLGVLLLRVKEADTSIIPDDTEQIIYCKQYPNFSELSSVILKLLSRVEKITGASLAVDIDVARDRGKIYAQYVEGEKENSLLEVNPEIAAQWHPYKNESITPLMVTANSNKTVWWQCEHGHEWQAVINSRNSGNGCPYCGGLLPVSGVNDLATVNPQLALEWHPFKNRDLRPRDFLPQSNKVVWWLCKKGHEWQAAINSRSSGNGCPYCANVKVLEGYNDMATTHLELIDEWHPSKNGGLSPKMFVGGSERKVWWQCATCGHEWEARIVKRTSGRGCPECAKKKRGAAYSQAMLAENGSLADLYPDIAAQWHPTKNETVLPTEVTSKTQKVFWWQCVKGHEWEASVANRTGSKGCPICSGKRTVAGANDLATKMPDLAKQWHPTLNDGLTPADVTVSARKYVWWQCEKGHEFQSWVYNRSKGIGCPYCAGRKPIPGETDLGTKNPKLATEWHPTKNGELKPIDVTFSSGKKVWWVCSKCGHEWETSIDSRNRGSGCPICARQKSKKSK